MEWKTRVRVLLLGEWGRSCQHHFSTHSISKSFIAWRHPTTRETGFHCYGRRGETDFSKQMPVSGQMVRQMIGVWALMTFWGPCSILTTPTFFLFERKIYFMLLSHFHFIVFFSSQSNMILNVTNYHIVPLNTRTFWFMTMKYLLVN